MNFSKWSLGLRGVAAAALLAIPLTLAAAPARAVNVGLELSLLMDVSGSVSASEFALQQQGYVQAFQSAAVQSAILGSVGGSIAVNLIQWSSGNQQVESVGWTLIDSATSSNAFATAINGIIRAFGGSTAPGSALNFAVPLFTSNAFDAPRQVIDVSGDGAQNDGADTSNARDAALAAGIDAINGVVILGEGGLLAFYQNNIQGGVGSFVLTANTFGDFATAIENKLVAEITGVPVPVPASIALFGFALLAMGAAARRRV